MDPKEIRSSYTYWPRSMWYKNPITFWKTGKLLEKQEAAGNLNHNCHLRNFKTVRASLAVLLLFWSLLEMKTSWLSIFKFFNFKISFSSKNLSTFQVVFTTYFFLMLIFIYLSHLLIPYYILCIYLYFKILYYV